MYFYSCGRDKVIILWDLESKRQLKTVALYDSIETMVVLPELFYINGLKQSPEGVSVVAGGENGNLISL